jgi:hypothetical protein
MQHHGSRDCHDGSNVALGDAIVMVSADAGESDDLFEVGEVAGELGGGERLGVVGEALLRSDSCVTAHSLEVFFRIERLVGVQTYLVLNENETGGVVDKDAPSSVHLVEFRFAGGGE